MKRRIHLFWWHLNRTDTRDNYGDILGHYLVKNLTHKKIVPVKHPKKFPYSWFKKHYVTVGSILSNVNRNSVVWGSGIIQSDQHVKEATFLSVRGPRTRKRLLDLGYDCPENYGDPALLMPLIFNPDIKKEYDLGIIPHYVDYHKFDDKFNANKDISIIQLLSLNTIEYTTQEILKCKTIISSSLHGVILAHAYGIPAIWVRMSDNLFGDDVKFYDYFDSVNLNYPKVHNISINDITIAKLEELLKNNKEESLPEKEIIKKRQVSLLQTCPFNDKNITV